MSARLGLPLIAKDAVKERLHDVVGGEGREWSRQLGVASFELLFHVLAQLLEHGCSVVAEGNFGRAEPFRSLPPARVVQVHVTAAPEVLRQRFATRPRRHPVHYDAKVVDEVPEQVRAGRWGPLDLEGDLHRIVTDESPDVLAAVDQICRQSAL